MNSLFYIIIIAFVVGYGCIALEHPLKINKTASALLLGVALWTLLVIGGESSIFNPDFQHIISENGNMEDSFIKWLLHELVLHLGAIAEILFFLMGAMTIVELVDTYGGFKIITDKIETSGRVRFLWILTLLTFFMSSVLDNMTTTIVMVTLLRKLVSDKKERWFFASMIILAANAGGGWSPIGDVTTIMLWVSGKVSAWNIILKTFLASFMSILVPLLILSFRLKGNFVRPQQSETALLQSTQNQISYRERLLMLSMGVGVLLFVPVFKSLTHLPPYLGMMGGLGFLWVLTELLRRRHQQRDNSNLTVTAILARIDIPSILFFLGILLAVAALEVCGHLMLLSQSLEAIPIEEPEKYFAISYIIGLLSSVIDNVPLVAGAMGMYSFERDHYFWEFIAYCAGTGGSILIIGSAAGVAAMGLEKIDFIWYLKRISLLALVGYTAGALTFIAQNQHIIKAKQEQTKEQTYKRPETNTGLVFQWNTEHTDKERDCFLTTGEFACLQRTK
jgi:Na+/H+ antiporter NhaD/arsenite permease-like protein